MRLPLPPQPKKQLTVLTCMDCRVDPPALLGFGVGDAHVLRNAGGVVTDDVLRSLSLSQRLLGTRQVVIVQHTNCGLHAEEDDLRERLGDIDLPGELHSFTDLDDSVRRSMERLRATPHLSDDVRGFVYDVASGELREVS